MQRFVIFATPRSGSNMLCSLLNSHPQCVCHHELFNPRGIRLALHLREAPPAMPDLVQRDARPLEFLAQVMDDWGGSGATGFKMTGTQNETVFEHLLDDTGVRKILLQRSNTLRELVSHKIAEQLDQWEVYDPDELQEQRPAVEISLQELEARQRQNRRYHRRIQQCLQQSSQPYHSCYYESLTDAGAQQDLLAFLGLQPDVSLHTLSVRQNSQPLDELISNYPELRAALTGTPFESQLMT